MQNLFINADNSLSLAGYAELKRLLVQYCQQAQFPPWRRRKIDTSPEASQQWRDGLQAALGSYLQARVWVQHSKTQEGQPMMRLFLSEGESQAHQLDRPKPSRHAWSLEVHEHPTWIPGWKLWQNTPIQAERLQDILTDEMGVDALKTRLASYAVAPYSAQDWQALEMRFGDALSMVWTDMNGEHKDVALAAVPLQALRGGETGVEGMAIILPSEWGWLFDRSNSFRSFDRELDIDPHAMFAVFGAQRRYRFALLAVPLQLMGAKPMACAHVLGDAAYAYLNLFYCSTGFYEASVEPLAQDQKERIGNSSA